MSSKLYDEMFKKRKEENPITFELSYWENHYVTSTIKKYIPQNLNIIDIGCGTGEITNILARDNKFSTFIGVDISEYALTVANNHKNTLNLSNIRFCKSTNEIADIIICSHVYEHIEDRKKFIDEIAKNNCNWLTQFFIFVPFEYNYDDPTHVVHFNETTLKEELSHHFYKVDIKKSNDNQLFARCTGIKVLDIERKQLTGSEDTIGIYRIKNEARWITRSINSISSVVSKIVVLDDGSTDDTVKLCKEYKNVEVLINNETTLDESRDKNKLLSYIEKYNPKNVVFIDGDEIVSNPEKIQATLKSSSIEALNFKFYYMWDVNNQVRIDGEYRDFRQGRAFKYKKGCQFKSTTHGGNFHCGSVPYNYKKFNIDCIVLHYGYIYKFDRIEKMEWYKSIDRTKNYSHLDDTHEKKILRLK